LWTRHVARKGETKYAGGETGTFTENRVMDLICGVAPLIN
jgi:hypothetical protein